MNITTKERIAILETKIDEVKNEVQETRKDVKALLLNNREQRVKIAWWDRLLMVIIAGVVGAFTGRLGR